MTNTNLKKLAEKEFERLMLQDMDTSPGLGFEAAAFIARKHLDKERTKRAAEKACETYLRVFRSVHDEEIRQSLFNRLYPLSRIFQLEKVRDGITGLENRYISYRYAYLTLPKEWFNPDFVHPELRGLYDAEL